MEFRLAKKQEFDSVRDLYWMLIDETSHLPSFPHWKKGLHPSDEWLLESLAKISDVCIRRKWGNSCQCYLK